MKSSTSLLKFLSTGFVVVPLALAFAEEKVVVPASTTVEPSAEDAEATDVPEEGTHFLRVEDIMEPPSEYHYAAFGRPDPFAVPASLAAPTVSGAGGTAVIGPRKTAGGYEIPVVSPLQTDISRLNLKGIWETQNGERKVMIMTQDNQGIIAKVGDPIGLSGKIIKINTDSLVARMYRLREDGSREFDDVTMWLVTPDAATQQATGNGRILLRPGQRPVVIPNRNDILPAGTPPIYPSLSRPQVPMPQTLRTDSMRFDPAQYEQMKANQAKVGAGVMPSSEPNKGASQ